MTEILGDSTERPLRLDEATEECENIRIAAELQALALQAKLIAERMATLVAHRSLFSGSAYRILVTVPENSGSCVTHYGNVIDEQPGPFRATHLTDIGEQGLEFYDADSDKTLKVPGHDFHITAVPAIRPVE